MKRIRIYTLLLTCLGLAAMVCFPSLLRRPQQGAAHAQRELVTVWLYGETLGAGTWVHSMAADYQKKNTGLSVWVRTVTAVDIRLLEEDYAHAGPDVLLFMAGAEVPAAYVEETQPLCLAGYALVRRSNQQFTPAPTSLFGVTPAPESSLSATRVPQSAWPGKIAADDGMGAYYLHLLRAPGGAALMPQEKLGDFLQQEDACVLLDTLEIRSRIAKGEGLELLEAVPGSDLMLCGAVMRGASDAAAGFVKHLLEEDAQRELSRIGLFSARGYMLYGAGTPILQAVEEALKGGWTPDALTWQTEREGMIHTGQALYK